MDPNDDPYELLVDAFEDVGLARKALNVFLCNPRAANRLAWYAFHGITPNTYKLPDGTVRRRGETA